MRFTRDTRHPRDTNNLVPSTVKMMGATGAMVRTLLRSVLLVAVVTGARGEDDHDHDHDGHVDEEGHMEVGGWVCVPSCVSPPFSLCPHKMLWLPSLCHTWHSPHKRCVEQRVPPAVRPLVFDASF
jgi:hypothetical protein